MQRQNAPIDVRPPTAAPPSGIAPRGVSFCIRAGGVLGLAIVMLGGCAGGSPGTPAGTHAGLDCVDDSARCVQQRQATLRMMVEDPSRSWVRQQASPRAYATGVRMFAYKKTKGQLSCAQLRHGTNEAGAAPSVLSNSLGHGLSPAQISRGKMFAGEVSRELNRELRRRCS